MRITHKKQAEDFIKLLAQAHTEIKTSIETKKNDTAMELLAQCQEGAIGLGNLIEKRKERILPQYLLCSLIVS